MPRWSECQSCGHQWEIVRRARTNKDWWTLDIPEHIDPAQPGIYEWRIADQSLYIGKSSRLSSRLREYPNNVRKLVNEAPYRKGKATAYREVHHELRRAHDSGIAVTVTILENCERCDLDERERHWIAIRKQEAEAGGPRLLNSN